MCSPPWMSHIYHTIFITQNVCVRASGQTKRARFSACSCVCLFVSVFFFSSCSCLLLLCDSDYIVIALDIVLLRVHARRANVYQEKMNVEFDLSGLSDRHVRRVNRLKLPNNTVAKFT